MLDKGVGMPLSLGMVAGYDQHIGVSSETGGWGVRVSVSKTGARGGETRTIDLHLTYSETKELIRLLKVVVVDPEVKR